MKKILLLLLYSNFVLALENDADKPITIDANSAEYKEKSGLSTYHGNVITVQGGMKVNSSKLVAYLKNGDVTKMVWTGKPAKFKQKQEGGDAIIGKALTIEYFPNKDLFVLHKKAYVKQTNVSYDSDLIKYDIRESLVKAGTKNSNSNRVRVIVEPKKKIPTISNKK